MRMSITKGERNLSSLAKLMKTNGGKLSGLSTITKGSVMIRTILHSLTALALAIIGTAAVAQDEDALPYKEGPVTIVTSVRTQPGKFSDYFRYLAGPYSQSMEEAKKQGIVTAYAFYAASPRSPDQPDIYLVETYPNMAALDTVTEKMTAIDRKIFGSLKAADKGYADRGEIRTILGSEMLRQLLPVKKGSTE
jgi:hypothetical protein